MSRLIILYSTVAEIRIMNKRETELWSESIGGYKDDDGPGASLTRRG